MEKFTDRYSILELQNKLFVIADKFQMDFIIGFKSKFKATVFLDKINQFTVDESDIRRCVNDIIKTR